MNIEVDKSVSPIVVEEEKEDWLPKCCPLCKTGFDKVFPKLLPCLHSFCQQCLESRRLPDQPQTPGEVTNHGTTTSKLKCPKCGQEFLVPNRGIASLIDNQFVLEAVAKPSGESETELHVCTSCEDNSSSTSYCLNCTEWLCEACVQAHQRVRVTKDHEIKSKEELKASLRNHGRAERSLFCQKHPSEKLKLFCANCERLTCRDCQLLEHKEHKYQFVNEAASRYREYFKKRLDVLGEKIGPLAESIEAVQNSTKHLDHKAEVVANEIKTSSMDIIRAVKQRENVLLNELKALVHFKRKMLTKQTKDLHLMQEILTHNYGFAKHAVMQGSDVSLLYSKRQLGSRIQNLLSLKYRVTPVAHSDLKFVTEAMKLCNSIHKAGSVMTPSTQRPSVSHGNGMPQRNPNIMAHPQNGPPANVKVSPLHSLNAFNNRHMTGILPSSSMVANTSHKPSSKVYPNVISSHGSLSVVNNGVRSSSMAYINSNSIHNPQMHGLPKSLNPPTSPLAPSSDTNTAYYGAGAKISGSGSVRIAPQSNGSGIPLHHMENTSKNQVRASPPSYEISRGRNVSSSSASTDNTSCPPSQQGNVFNSSPRDMRSTLTTHGVDQTTSFVPSPKTNQISPKPPPLSSSPLSPLLAKASPSPSLASQSSLSPSHVSPKPQASPRPSQVASSPLPSPLPTFLDSEVQDALAGNVKVKVEKDLELPEERACSEVKKESKVYSSCGFASGGSFQDTTACGPPSNNSSNDDWCAVCHNGGELLCCDTCPKVFHLQCHVPSLTITPSDAWSCGLCQSSDKPSSKPADVVSGTHKRRAPIGGMSERDTKVCEKMLLELFCHADSLPFHDKVSKAVPNYYKVIQRPMDLTSIKTKLQPVHFEHYNNVNEFIADCKLIFNNCALFNDADSEVGKMGKRLAADFQNIIRKYLPRHEDGHEEPRVKRRKDDTA